MLNVDAGWMLMAGSAIGLMTNRFAIIAWRMTYADNWIAIASPCPYRPLYGFWGTAMTSGQIYKTVIIALMAFTNLSERQIIKRLYILAAVGIGAFVLTLTRTSP